MPTNVSGVSAASDVGGGWSSGSANSLGPDTYGPSWGDVLSDAVNEAVNEVGDFGAGAGVSASTSVGGGGGWSSGSANSLGPDTYGGGWGDNLDGGDGGGWSSGIGADGKGDFAGDWGLDSGFYDFGSSNVVNDDSGTTAFSVGGAGGITNVTRDSVPSDPFSPVSGGVGVGLPGSLSLDSQEIARNILGVDPIGLGTPIDALNNISMSADMFLSPSELLGAAMVRDEIGTHLNALEGNITKDEERIEPAPMTYTPLPGAISPSVPDASLPFSSIMESPFIDQDIRNMTEADMRDRLANYLNSGHGLWDQFAPQSMSEQLGLKPGEFERPNIFGEPFPPENITDIPMTPAPQAVQEPSRPLPEPVSPVGPNVHLGPEEGGKYQDRIPPADEEVDVTSEVSGGTSTGGSASVSVDFGGSWDSGSANSLGPVTYGPSWSGDDGQNNDGQVVVGEAVSEHVTGGNEPNSNDTRQSVGNWESPTSIPSDISDGGGDGQVWPLQGDNNATSVQGGGQQVPSAASVNQPPASGGSDVSVPEFRPTPVYEYPSFYGIYGYRFRPGDPNFLPGRGVYNWMRGLL